MALTEQEMTILLEARKARQSEEFLTVFRSEVEESRNHRERMAERYEPSDARMSEVYNF